MKREELYPIDGAVCTHGKDYLNKAKADSVMDAMETRIKELKAENERLKKKIAAYEDERKCLSETITCDANVIYNLNKENAKLKCLALHAMSYAVVSLTSNTNKFKPFRLFVKYNDAYRKAKKALMEGK